MSSVLFHFDETVGMMIKEIIEKINKSKTFLITAHMNLEGDALGSELASYIALRKMGKKVVICNHDFTPESYNFLPFAKVIKNEFKEKKVDVAMVLDCSDPFRTGKIKDYLSRAECVINIDHHISNSYFGDINWVEPKASSACQVLYELWHKLGIIDKKSAICLYTGIFTDSGGFTYTSTNSRTHEIAADLLRYGIAPNKIYEQLRSLCSPRDLKTLSLIMSSLKFDSTGKVCWAVLKVWEEKDYDLTEIIFSMMRLLKRVEVLILLKKIDKNKVRINFRSRAAVDVNKIAKVFGGGGHKRASGATVEGELEAVEQKVISYLEGILKANKEADVNL